MAWSDVGRECGMVRSDFLWYTVVWYGGVHYVWCGTVWYLLNREGSGAMQLCAHMTALWYSVVCHVMVCVVSSDVVHCDAGVV